ncbi:MAG: methyl-accepting chemotaxis protein [Treponema sp.]|jgi:methyl-accepting chemotaxis protein|nr:methyl-accepting chemotaxis protein [Treponema sp.]
MKSRYSLRFQFIITFTIFLIVVNVITTVIGIQQLSETVIRTFADQGVLIVKGARDIVDGDSFEALAKSLDTDDPYYEEARVKLLEFKKMTNCLYLYTMAPKEGSIWQFIIDGSAEPWDEDFSAMGDEDDTDEFDDAFRVTLETGEITASGLTDQGEWGWLVTVYAPIKNSAGETVGIIACDFDGEPLRKAIAEEITNKIKIFLIAVGIQVLLVLYFMHLIFSPIKKINRILKEISSGEGDLTKRLNIKNKNETGELAFYFNKTLDKIKNLVVSIKKETSELQNVGNDLASNMEQTAGEINQITTTIMSIKKKIISQAAAVTETGATMGQISSSIEKLDKNVDIQSSSVSASSSAIEEMLANIQSVTRTLINNAENVEELIKASDLGRGSLQKVTQDIHEIENQSEGLLQINAVMENISSQTNLLSMNAAIEAAHAGELGKGFAVVAGEIRKLAVSSSEQSKTIFEVLKKIKTAIDTITFSTNVVLEKFKAIDGHVRVVSEQETNIRAAMEEQGQGSHQILEAITKVKEMTQTVKENSTIMAEGSREVIAESRNLEQTTVEISNGMDEMARGAEEVNVAVSHINDISKKNKMHIDVLFAEVSKFKVDD